MNQFSQAFTYINEVFYEPNHLTVTDVREETQNSEYGAGVFQLNCTSVRFRVAKITPTKIGQFVAFWEKDGTNKNQAFSAENAPDLLVINTFSHDQQSFGQFVFPKEVLVKHKILKSATTKGKMAIRVYPSWDTPTSKQATATQKWQLPYFVVVDPQNSFNVQELISLYTN
ncbi:mep operon protein MepB [Solibacillus sp. R5-41]|uniref:MepB family protein n=1 Tax=Solibacillus sp. R5-41 TaxID=2048654 RepID=UPI000C124C25|nr:MepB family protein [Solibacillus sp. R5-41]ATP41080.1 mep operon protein MepB [Solibacillus sp. R5-41]